MKTNEEWKLIPGIPHYLVSNYGRVYSGKSKKLLKAATDAHGYKVYGLRISNKTSMKKEHQLVGLAFLDNPEGYKQINHIDRDKINNHVDNLEWCSCAHNIEHGQAKTYKFYTPDNTIIKVFKLNKF